MNLITDAGEAATGLSGARIMVALVLIAALLGIGAWGGHALSRSHYEPLLADANKTIGSLTTANESMAASVEVQNVAIAGLQEAAKRRERDAAQAIQQARQQSAKELSRAQSILLLRPPSGVNQCEAAQTAFDDELRFERGAE